MNDRERVVMATANPHKATEIRAVLVGAPFDLVDRPADVPDVVEDGETLLDNARLKAIALVEATGLPAVADDTGFEVDALGGEPGVRAARYAGPNATYEQNTQKVLTELAGLPSERRTARFRTVALLRRIDGSEVVGVGSVEGRVLDLPRPGGWGYEPIFVPTEGGGRTFSEMTESEKSAISHRGRAFRNLVEQIRGTTPL